MLGSVRMMPAMNNVRMANMQQSKVGFGQDPEEKYYKDPTWGHITDSDIKDEKGRTHADWMDHLAGRGDTFTPQYDNSLVKSGLQPPTRSGNGAPAESDTSESSNSPPEFPYYPK